MVMAEAVSHSEGASVNLAVLVFRQNAECAGADFFEGGREGKDGAIYDWRFTIYEVGLGIATSSSFVNPKS